MIQQNITFDNIYEIMNGSYIIKIRCDLLKLNGGFILCLL